MSKYAKGSTTTAGSSRTAGKSYASGTGIDPTKITINQINVFTIFSRDDSDKPLKVSEEKVVVKVDGPVPVDVVEVFDNGDASYDCEWEPKAPGTYKITVTIDGRPIPNSPITLNLGGGASGASTASADFAGQSSASGVGLDGSKISAGNIQLFTIFSKDASGKPLKVPESDVVVKITGPAPVDIVEVFDNDDATYDCEWQPPVVGSYSVDISISGKKLKDSPYIVNMGGAPASQPKPASTATSAPTAAAPAATAATEPSGKSTASGRGLDAAVIKPNEVTVFTVWAKNDDGTPAKITEVDIAVKIDGPGSPPADVFENDDGSFDVEWEPTSAATYVVSCKVKNKHVVGSPFTLDLAKGITTKSAAAESKPAATPASAPAPTAAAKKGATATPAASTAAAPKKGPAATAAPAKTTTPATTTAPAPAAASTAGKSIASGRGLDGSRIKANDVAVFTIFPKDANGNTWKVSDDQITVAIDGPGNPPADIFDNPDGSWDVEWEPPSVGVYTVKVAIDGKPIVGSPFVVDMTGGAGAASTTTAQTSAPAPAPVAAAPQVVEARGRGLDDTRLKIGQTGVFTLYPTFDIMDNDITIKITGPGSPTAEIFHNGDNTYDVEWEPLQGGKFTINVDVLGKPIKNSPFVLNIDPNKIWTPPAAQPKKTTPAPTQPASTPAPTSAPATAQTSSSGTTSDATGKGLVSGQCVLNDINLFTIFPRDSSGKLIIVPEDKIFVSITGPANVTPDIFDNPDGSWDVEWSSSTPGEYTINVKVNNAPVKNSPFKVTLGSPTPQSYSDATGLGLRGDRIKIGGDPALFTVYPRDSSGKIIKINEDQLSVTIKGAATVKPDLFDNEDDSWDVEWSPPKPGEYTIDVKIDNIPIKGSPFVVKI